MPTPTIRLIRMTDDHGDAALPDDEMHEPEPGSVVLTEGTHGTAWQRHFSDGKWHRAGSSQRKNWHDLIQQRNVVLVYDAEER